MYYAIIKNKKVENITVCDIEPFWFNTEETSIVLLNENDNCMIGMVYDETKYPRFRKEEE
jgi:hypothetical protein